MCQHMARPQRSERGDPPPPAAAQPLRGTEGLPRSAWDLHHAAVVPKLTKNISPCKEVLMHRKITLMLDHC